MVWLHQDTLGFDNRATDYSTTKGWVNYQTYDFNLNLTPTRAVIKIDGDDTTGSRCALVYGQMNEPPGARARVGLTGLTVAEYFRDEENQDVLLFVDNIFRFTQACSEVSALLGRIPSAVGY